MTHAAGAGLEVELVTLEGETVAVVTLPAPKVRPVARGEMAHARPVAWRRTDVGRWRARPVAK